MIVIKIMNEFLHSPIWTYEDDFITDDYPIISDDTQLQELSKQIEELFSSYFEFDSHNQPCWFNHEKEKADKEQEMYMNSNMKENYGELLLKLEAMVMW